MPVVRDVRCDLLRYRLAAPAGGSGVTTVDLLALLCTEADGHTGFGFSYVIGGADALPLAALSTLLERSVIGVRFEHPAEIWHAVDAGFNRTGGGPYRTALAAIDVALWDLVATMRDVPLGVAMGGAPRVVPVYGSGGFRANQAPDEAAAAARAAAARGLRAVKPRAAGTPADRALLAAVAAAVAVPVMVDANERCAPDTAADLVRFAAEIGALFVEEPLPASDIGAYRALARVANVPIAWGEHARTLGGVEPFVHDRLCAVIQPDLQALGGLTPCLAVARFAAAHGVAVAPHFLPGFFVHLAAAAPNVTWLEEFPLLEPLFAGMPLIEPDGTYVLPPGAGHGLRLDPDARAAFGIGGARGPSSAAP